MYLRPIRKRRPNGQVEQTWALVESVRTARGPRQRTVAYLGDLAAEARCGIQAAATETRAFQPLILPRFRGQSVKRRADVRMRLAIGSLTLNGVVGDCTTLQ
jgi:hypothetical protein